MSLGRHRPDGIPPEPEDGTLEDPAGLFEALANPRRLELLHLLTEPKYLREIASELGVTRQTAHHHLDRLVEAGLLERRTASRESGRVTEYVVVPSGLAGIHELVERISGLPAATLERPGGTEEGGLAPKVRIPPEPPALWVVGGLDRGTELELGAPERGPWLVGRAPDTDLVLEADPFVSAEHAEVWRDGEGLVIRDLASTNGTYVNGERVGRRNDAALGHGDVVAVGRTLLHVVAD